MPSFFTHPMTIGAIGCVLYLATVNDRSRNDPPSAARKVLSCCSWFMQVYAMSFLFLCFWATPFWGLIALLVALYLTFIIWREAPILGAAFGLFILCLCVFCKEIVEFMLS